MSCFSAKISKFLYRKLQMGVHLPLQRPLYAAAAAAGVLCTSMSNACLGSWYPACALSGLSGIL